MVKTDATIKAVVPDGFNSPGLPRAPDNVFRGVISGTLEKFVAYPIVRGFVVLDVILAELDENVISVGPLTKSEDEESVEDVGEDTEF